MYSYHAPGHVLCAKCCNGVIESPQISSLCPFCRTPYTRDGVRVVRVDIPDSQSDGRRHSPTSNSASTSSLFRQAAQLPEPRKHPATCDSCRQIIVGDRYVGDLTLGEQVGAHRTQKCIHCPDFDMCSQCFPSVPVSSFVVAIPLISASVTSPFVTRSTDSHVSAAQKTTSSVPLCPMNCPADLDAVHRGATKPKQRAPCLLRFMHPANYRHSLQGLPRPPLFVLCF
jgi:hypothetical protein